MEILLDANTLLSALIGDPNTSQHQKLMVAALNYPGVRVCVARKTLDEVRDVGTTKPYFTSRYSPAEIENLVAKVVLATDVLEIQTDPPPSHTRDPKDDYLVETMLEHDLTVLVSGDRDLVALDGQFGFEVMSSSECMALIEALLS